MTEDTIEREITIQAPVERVWALVTEPEHLGTWFGDAGATVELRPGGTLSLSWAEHGTMRAEVVAVEPTRRFAYRWVPGEIGTPLTDTNTTLVEFTLEPRDGGTVLRVIESGFAALDGGEDTRTGNIVGWESELGQLGTYAAGVTA